MGVKPCCLLPQCDLCDCKCAAHDKALVQWRKDRKTYRSEDQPLPTPMESSAREQRSRGTQLQNEGGGGAPL